MGCSYGLCGLSWLALEAPAGGRGLLLDLSVGGPGVLLGPQWAVLGCSWGLCGQSWLVFGPCWVLAWRSGPAKWPFLERDCDLARGSRRKGGRNPSGKGVQGRGRKLSPPGPCTDFFHRYPREEVVVMLIAVPRWQAPPVPSSHRSAAVPKHLQHISLLDV